MWCFIGDTWDGIGDLGEMRRGFLNHYGDFSAGIPSEDIVARVLGLLNPKCGLRDTRYVKDNTSIKRELKDYDDE